MNAYYNEFDPKAAAWLRELIKDGQIAPGIVDERSICDVRPDELVGYTQVHLFAGIGAWSYGLREAGWPDDRPVWTASLPCQPFSCAGSQQGFDDDRHLWPVVCDLIKECRPSCIIGEQSASKSALEWWDVVANDLEAEDYATAAVDMAAGSVGAYHQRHRLWWVATSSVADSISSEPSSGRSKSQQLGGRSSDNSSGCPLANPTSDRLIGSGSVGAIEERWQPEPRSTGQLQDGFEGSSAVCAVDNANGERLQKSSQSIPNASEQFTLDLRGDFSAMGDTNGQQPVRSITGSGGDREGSIGRIGTTEDRSSCPAIWANTHWLQCTDGKYRAADRDTYPLSGLVGMARGRIRGEVERGLVELFGSEIDPEIIKGIAKGVDATRNWGSVKSTALALANGSASGMVSSGLQGRESTEGSQEFRAMILKGAGNSIVAPLATEFIRSVMDSVVMPPTLNNTGENNV
jgi:DNA (cytosine-5)-methyltransferase 1